MIKCPNCGAQLKFNAKSKMVTCEYCRSKFSPKELKEKIKVAEEVKVPEKVKDTYEGKEYLCSQCGAKLLTFDNTAITFCSYCGSQAMVEQEMIKQEVPDYIIPFKKTKEECIESYKKVLSKSLFAPSYMKQDIVVNKFRGIYMPYAVYKASCHGKVRNSGSKYSHRSGDYVYYNDYSITADVDADYDGISYDLISNFYDKFSHAIPHNFKEAEEFNPNYLAGFYADKSDVEDYLYELDAEAVATNDSVNKLSKEKTFRKYGCSNPHANFNISEKKMGMFPIYFLAIRDKKNTYVNYAVINGQTGKAVVDLPVDFKKYILVSLILTIPIFLLINNLLVLTPKKICLFSIVFSIISLIISIYQSKRIKEREEHLDDIGYTKNGRSKTIINDTSIQPKVGLLLMTGFMIFLFIIVLTRNSIPISAIVIPISFIVLTYLIISKLSKGNSYKTITIHRNDSGNKTIKPNKLSKKEVFKNIYKQLIGIGIGLFVLFVNFVNDIYYYVACIAMFVLVIISFYDLLKQHNSLVSTKLPQLEKRGGDERE